MSISNSYHTSAKDHAITSAGKLSAVQKHNARGYFAWDYDSSKIHNIIGSASSLSQDTKDYINKKFEKSVEEYNSKQRQKCRRITENPFDYFCGNKSTDVANETLFQVGDMEFWEQHRNETEVKRNGKTYIRKSYPEEIKEVMDDIFRLQADAYEQIYQTHGDKILEKIIKAKEEAENYIAALDKDLCWKYEQLFLQPKKRDGLIKSMQLTDAELESYEKYFRHRSDLSAIEKKRLIERTSSGSMEIKLINLVSHYDEWSPHAHAVSVCSTSGYKQGLSNRIAKSVVLNKWSLEVIQDRMREIAVQEMTKHPELFPELTWRKKGKGRNMDYSKEQYIWMQQKKLKEATKEAEQKYDEVLDIVSELKKERGAVRNEVEKLRKENDAAQAELAKIIQEKDDKRAEYQEKIAQWDYDIALMENEQEYISAAETSQDTIEHLNKLCNDLLSRKSPLRDRSIERAFLDAFRGFYEALSRSLKRLRKYEAFNALPEEQCYSIPLTEAKETLDKQIKLTAKTRQSLMHEHQQQKNKKHEEYGE